MNSTEKVTPWVVMKFGGTSVSSRNNWDTIYRQLVLRINEGFRPVLVHSAFSGVSNALEQLLSLEHKEQQQRLFENIKQLHLKYAVKLEVDGPALCADYFSELENLLTGAQLVGEVTPRLRARVLALGELLSTTIGAAYLAQRGLAVEWKDARAVLTSENQGANGETHVQRMRFLSANCRVSSRPELQQEFAKTNSVIVTQGFIASDPTGATVLLGRGGSDTSGSYFAVLLDAARLEIWTDVPGMFSTNPRIVPSARVLRKLDYAEAQEIAATGSKVLHPRCIEPVWSAGIPLFVRSTESPELAGTEISAAGNDAGPQVKAISARKGVTLISLETISMWRQVGFLADIFSCFKQHGVSVDLVSTSETNITVSLEAPEAELDVEVLNQLVNALGQLAEVRLIRGCAAVSLVGRKIRALLHEIGPKFSIFEEEKIYLVNQAANDLNFTFVCDDAQADRIVRGLHELLFRGRTSDALFGETWEELHASQRQSPRTAWWRDERERLLELAPTDAALFVYNLDCVEQRYQMLANLSAIDRVFYAIKANAHPALLARLASVGACFECVSPGEVQRVLELKPAVEKSRILFTPNFASLSEYQWAFELGITVTLDDMFVLTQWPELVQGKQVFLRLDPGRGAGHHAHVQTGGKKSKFGIGISALDEVLALVEQLQLKVIGLHIHAGSGILQAQTWSEHAELLQELSSRFPAVRVFNLGGGLGVSECAEDDVLDLAQVDKLLTKVKQDSPGVEFWIEPGRFLSSEAGVLLARVTQIKRKSGVSFIGINTGMNSLIRPALYGAYHEIVNLSRLAEPKTQLVTVVGPICESGDQLGVDRQFPETQVDDVLLIANAGAYGRVMSSNYNLREPAAEVVFG